MARWKITLAVGLVVIPALQGAPAPLPGESAARFQGRVAEEVKLPPPFGAKAPPRFTDLERARYHGQSAPAFGAAVRQAQLAIWATSSTEVPASLAADVRAFRARWRIDAGSVRRTYLAPPAGRAAQARFLTVLATDNKAVGRMIWRLNVVLDELKAVEKLRGAQPVRWRVNYDLMRGCLEAHLATLEHHQFALGMMRKEPLPLNLAVHAGWQLVPVASRGLDRDCRELVRTSSECFERVVSEHPGTYWAELAQRAKQVKLGREWRALPAAN